MTDLFNQPIDRRGTFSGKWDSMESLFGVSPQDGIAMWTADSDFPTAPCVQEALRAAVDHGCFGYYGPRGPYRDAVQWWMHTRHDWAIDPDWIVPCQGLGHGIASCIDVWSAPGEGIVTFNPVYHEFRIKAEKAGRRVVACPLQREGDTYVLDLDDAQSRLTGDERILLWCSPQNPSGRVWSAGELRAVADFAIRNDLILVSDEVHHDLVYPGHDFVPMHIAAPEVSDRLVVTTAASKTFNIAGLRLGSLIIPDATLRQAMVQRMRSLDYDPASLGFIATIAAYSPDGAEWVDAQVAHLDANRRSFDAALNAIPGVRSLPLQSTYLAWVDFADTGMDFREIRRRIHEQARIAPSPGPDFGPGGETFMRFNLATTHDRVIEAGQRMQAAFADLQ